MFVYLWTDNDDDEALDLRFSLEETLYVFMEMDYLCLGLDGFIHWPDGIGYL